ncbi:MAG: hypothetical protein QXH91_04780 [Candidatus Bathyarchaeia archaeon]
MTVYSIFLRRDERSRWSPSNLIIIFLVCLVIGALLINYAVYQRRFLNGLYDFPNTRLGRSIFDILSFPILLFRYFLVALQLSIPTYLGVAIGVELLVVTWALILVLSSRLQSSSAINVRVEYFANCVGSSAQTSPPSKVKREKSVGLALATIFAIAIRIFPLLRYPLPIGPDVPAYIGWMSMRVPSPGFYPPFSNFLWPTLGVILGISASLPVSQLGLFELTSIFLNVMVTLAAYGAVVGLTKNNRVGLIAAVFAAASPSQYWHSAGLYRTMLGISLAFVTLSAYQRAMASRSLKNVVLLFFLTYATCLAHPYPAIILLLGIIGYALVQNVARLKFLNIWQLKLTSSLILGVALPFLIAAHISFGSLTGMGNWLTEPTVAPIWSFENMLEYFGLLPLLLALLGILVACRRRNEHELLIIVWFFAAFIIAEQTLFHVYFWYDAPEVPRFLMLVYMPLIILASIGFQWLLSTFNWVKSRNLQLQLKTVFTCFFIGTLLLSSWLYVANQPLHSISINEYHAIMFLDHYAPAESIVSAIGGFSIRPWIAYLTHLQPAYTREVTEDYLIRKAPGSMDIILSTSFNRMYDDGAFLIYQRNC